ncbi:MAG: ABC transporter permease subunit [Actinomycetales bacterium]|nr:ABC transporter permease subunit [Actinomycetales bacterium]
MKAEQQTAEMKKLDKFKRKSVKKLYDGGTPGLRGTMIKIIALGIIDAFAVFTAYLLLLKHQYAGTIGVLLVALLVSFLYLRRGGLPAKYLTPGLLFLAVFQVYVVVFSGYISFTNYGSMHNSDRASAVNAIRLASYDTIDSDFDGYQDSGKDNNQDGVADYVDASGDVIVDAAGNPVGPDATTGAPPAGVVKVPYYTVSVVRDGAGVLGFIATQTTMNADGSTSLGDTFVGTQDSPLVKTTAAVDTNGDGAPDQLDGYTTLNDDAIGKIQQRVFDLKVLVAEGSDTFIRTEDGASAFKYKFNMIWNEKAQTFTRVSDNAVFQPGKDGFFHIGGDVKAEKIDIGWVETIGTDNYAKIFSDERLRGPLLKIISWTFIFAIGSVVSTFIVGLALALLFNREDMRGKKVYRALMILPYAFPAFLSAYVWKGLFNTENGFINKVILQPITHGDFNIPWLTEEGPARIAVLLANLWLGFPYMFLISTGALQAIPAELTESAVIDGATPWQQMRLIKFPLLMITLAPLLVASFAFNFNNFTLIYLLTQGGPTDISAGDLDAGGTDILITFVYKIAFSTGHGRDYGLASAFSVLIFLFVGTISYLSFRRTRTLEDIA